MSLIIPITRPSGKGNPSAPAPQEPFVLMAAAQMRKEQQETNNKSELPIQVPK